ncbi:carbamate kinase, partial [Neisseria bacilliformis ATCC BAA-1200]
ILQRSRPLAVRAARVPCRTANPFFSQKPQTACAAAPHPTWVFYGGRTYRRVCRPKATHAFYAA